MADITIETNNNDISRLSKKLRSMSKIRFDAVVKKNVTQMLNRARSGGTPVDTGELRKSSGVSGDEMGYIAEYAPHVEYGHRLVGGGWVPGQQFLKANANTQREFNWRIWLKQYKKKLKLKQDLSVMMLCHVMLKALFILLKLWENAPNIAKQCLEMFLQFGFTLLQARGSLP